MELESESGTLPKSKFTLQLQVPQVSLGHPIIVIVLVNDSPKDAPTDSFEYLEDWPISTIWLKLKLQTSQRLIFEHDRDIPWAIFALPARAGFRRFY